MSPPLPVGAQGTGQVHQHLWGHKTKGREGHRTVPQVRLPRGFPRGQCRNVALKSAGIGHRIGVASREPCLLALGVPRLRGLGSVVLLQPVTCPSSSLLR